MKISRLIRGSSPKRPLLMHCEDNSEVVSGKIHERVVALLRERADLYSGSRLKIWSDWVDVEVLADLIAREAQTTFLVDGALTICPLQIISGRSKQADLEVSEVICGSGLLSTLRARIQRICPKASRYVLLVDATVRKRWGVKLLESLKGLSVVEIEIPSGERSKSLTLLGEICEELLKGGVTRDDVVIAVGGGVVGDLGGFVASVYMRGISLVHVPTTLVAQVDSAIGGKTAVNAEGGKNIIGTFYNAKLTLSDHQLLETLPEREYLAGLAEVVKYGLIAQADFFEWLEQNISQILVRDSRCLREIVEVSTVTKLEHVVSDITDRTGKRARLNFGHTVGHAVEKLTGYGRFLHGEAIAIGMIEALKLGEKLKITDQSARERTDSLLRKFKLPVSLPIELMDGVDEFVAGDSEDGADKFSERWGGALLADKKRSLDKINFVCIEQVGASSIVEVELPTLLESLAEAR